jgi:hypothetical protein
MAQREYHNAQNCLFSIDDEAPGIAVLFPVLKGTRKENSFRTFHLTNDNSVCVIWFTAERVLVESRDNAETAALP